MACGLGDVPGNYVLNECGKENAADGRVSNHLFHFMKVRHYSALVLRFFVCESIASRAPAVAATFANTNVRVL